MAPMKRTSIPPSSLIRRGRPLVSARAATDRLFAATDVAMQSSTASHCRGHRNYATAVSSRAAFSRRWSCRFVRNVTRIPCDPTMSAASFCVFRAGVTQRDANNFASIFCANKWPFRRRFRCMFYDPLSVRGTHERTDAAESCHHRAASRAEPSRAEPSRAEPRG